VHEAEEVACYRLEMEEDLLLSQGQSMMSSAPNLDVSVGKRPSPV
jgi:hypothetical protein